MTPGNSDINQLLRQMLDEMRGMNQRLDATNQRLDATNQRLDATNQRFDATNERLEAVRVELKAEIAQTRNEAAHNLLASEMRMATRVTEQTAATRDLYTLLTERFELRDRVERCEQQIAELQRQE